MMFWKKSVTLENGATELHAVAVSAANPLPVNATVTATASTVAKATAAAPSYSEGDIAAPLSVDLAGGLRITGTISATSAIKSTAADPSYSEGATTNPFSSDLAGYQRVKAKQSGTWTVGVDQSTPGTTNAVDVTNFPLTVDVNSGVKSNSTLRVVIATDQPQNTNPFKVDGSAVTQPVSGTFWQATQPVSGTFWQATQPVSGTFWQATQPVSIATAPVLVAGSALIGNVGHGKTIKTAAISAITADTDVVAAVTSKRIKVIVYALFTTGTSASTLAFKSDGAAGTLLANVMLQSQASAIFGANLAIPAPSFLFATVAGEKLTLDVGNTDPITGFITYFDDDAT